MMKTLKSLLILAILSMAIVSCEKKENEATPPEIPPYESMSIDFNKLNPTQKSAVEDTYKNYGVAAITVTVWNFVLGTTLVVPVATFYNSFKEKPVFLSDKKWQWSYEVKVLGASYNARLTGEVRTSDIKWEMYVARAGIGAFDEFKWFEGVSDLDGEGGQWILYHSHEVQEQVLQIDWTKEGAEIGAIQYTYIRESSNGRNDQLAKDSYLSYGLKVDDDYNAFYKIKYVSRKDFASTGFLNVDIEWNTTSYNGRIKAPHYVWLDNLESTDWRCWDGEGIDTVCN